MTVEISHSEMRFTARRITKMYLDFLASIENTDEYKLLDNDYNMCLELYRHSLCILLGLESTLGYASLNGIVDQCTAYLSQAYSFKKNKFKSEALLQACIHYIGFTKSHAEGGV